MGIVEMNLPVILRIFSPTSRGDYYGEDDVTGSTTGASEPTKGRPHSVVPLDQLLKPDFPARRRGLARRGDLRLPNEADNGPYVIPSWSRLSDPVHLDAETYVPQELIPDEVLTRLYADRGRPHSILNRPPPEPDPDEEDFLGDPTTWEFREELRECETCGEPFLANAHNHRYCSPYCAHQGRSFTRICLECGQEFETDRPEQMYCSLQCSGRAKRNPANDRLCRECGGPFHATRSQQVFCSRSCAWAWRKKERDR